MDEWMPTIRESQELDEEKAEAETARFEWLYQEQMKKYLTRVETYKKNKEKAFSFLFGQCRKH